MNKLKGATVLVVLVFSWLMLSGFVELQTVLKVMPQTRQARVGEDVTVELRLEQVAELYGTEIHLTFDPNVVQVVDADSTQEGVQIEPGVFPRPDFVVQNAADNQLGQVDYALTQLPPTEPGKGDGVVARITFRAQKAGMSQIYLERFMLANTRGESIQAVPQHGQIRVTGSSTWLFAAVAGVAALLIVGGSIGFVLTKRK